MLDTALLLDSSQPLKVNHRASVWRGYTIEYSAMPRPLAYEFQGSNSAYHYLANHDIIFRDAELEIDGFGRVPGKDIRGKLAYIPCNMPFKGWGEPEDRQNSFTTLAFCPHLISEELECVFDTTKKEPLIYFQNESLKSSLVKLEMALKHPDSKSSLYLETLGLATILEANMTLEEIWQAQQARRGLSQNQMRLVSEYILENITKDLTLEELAGLVRLSRFHFSRAFKASFGESPIRYINRERFKLAEDRLRKSRQPIAEIAKEVGFGTPQNFLVLFKKQKGITPSEFRNRG